MTRDQIRQAIRQTIDRKPDCCICKAGAHDLMEVKALVDTTLVISVMKGPDKALESLLGAGISIGLELSTIIQQDLEEDREYEKAVAAAFPHTVHPRRITDR